MQKRTLLVGVGITAALVLGTGGGAYAAASITGANVVNGSLTGSDIKNSSLTGSDVKNGSISSSDLTTGVNGLYDNRKAKTATISHDGSYGSVVGKAVAVEPATGFTFDTAMAPRPR